MEKKVKNWIRHEGVDYPVYEEEKDSIVESVINQFKERSEVGIKKYGTTLDRNDLTTLEWMQHLREELMDGILYLTKLEQEWKQNDVSDATK